MSALLLDRGITNNKIRASLKIFNHFAPQPFCVVLSVTAFLREVRAKNIPGSGYNGSCVSLFFLQPIDKPSVLQVSKICKLLNLSLSGDRQQMCSGSDRQLTEVSVLRQKRLRAHRKEAKVILSAFRLSF